MAQGPIYRRRGFTLIELLTVIVILAILAAFAVPRFMDGTDEAHESAMKGVTGSFSTAVSSARAQWLADGGAGGSVNFAGGTIPLSSLGWPTPVTGTMDCNGLWYALMQNPPPVTNFIAPLVAGDGFWSLTVANPTLSLCLYVYRPSYPRRPMWIAYYGHHATQPLFNGRLLKSGF